MYIYNLQVLLGVITKPGPSGPVTPVHIRCHSTLPIYNHHGAPGHKITTFEFKKEHSYSTAVRLPSPSPLLKVHNNCSNDKGRGKSSIQISDGNSLLPLLLPLPSQSLLPKAEARIKAKERHWHLPTNHLWTVCFHR